MSHSYDHVSYPKPFIRLKPSNIVNGGVGAFAMKDFKKDDVIVPAELFADNNTITTAEYNLLDTDTKDMVTAHSTITIGKLFIPENLNLLRPINYFNHSCDANTGFNKNDDYVAVRDIKKGEEFLLDYSYLNTDPDYAMSCSCGSQHCRKVITGNEWKNSEFVSRFGQYFCSTVRELLH